MLGAALPVRNNAWLNAGPPAWIAFSADNGDIKFPMKLPIIPETHEKTRLFDINRQTCCEGVSDLDLFYQTQATQAMAAGYFGGYTAKMQDIGRLELQRMEKTLHRSYANSSGHETPQQQFVKLSKRLLKDLEAKGIVRTAVETTNLALHANHYDKSRAECFRTFPTVTFPVTQLLCREEIENNRKGGASAITGVRSNSQHKSYTDAPADLLYGFRSTGQGVQTLSVFEMLRYWSIERIGTPTQKPRRLGAKLV